MTSPSGASARKPESVAVKRYQMALSNVRDLMTMTTAIAVVTVIVTIEGVIAGKGEPAALERKLTTQEERCFVPESPQQSIATVVLTVIQVLQGVIVPWPTTAAAAPMCWSSPEFYYLCLKWRQLDYIACSANQRPEGSCRPMGSNPVGSLIHDCRFLRSANV